MMQCNQHIYYHLHHTGKRPFALFHVMGVPPTLLKKQRTGELTPPGIPFGAGE
jgi:hypothetical protein